MNNWIKKNKESISLTDLWKDFIESIIESILIFVNYVSDLIYEKIGEVKNSWGNEHLIVLQISFKIIKSSFSNSDSK